MAKLGLLDVEGTKYTLNLGETYLVGRKSNEYSHDIEINDATVDIKHCILDFTERSPKLFDISSKCGTFVNGTRVSVFQMIPIVKSTTIQFGNVEAMLQLACEGDSGFLEERLTPPAKENSEIICCSPENVTSSGSRLKNTLKSNSQLTSTPNATTSMNSSLQKVTKCVSEFLVPTGVPRRSAGSNTSSKSADSFFIPETQFPVENNNNKTSNFTNTSIDTDKSKEKDVSINEDVDDFFIPETQEVVGAGDKLSNYPRVAFGNENVNETIAEGDKIPSSQFRICTQDFIGSDDDLSNNSDDILANVPCSLVIPTIRHSPVKINDLLNANNDDEEIEKEMSALQWSKKTADDPENSATPDNVLPADGLVTPDIMQEKDKAAKETVSQCSTPDMFGEPEQRTSPASSGNMESSLKENEVPPEIIESQTQVFIKPLPMNKSITKPSLPPCDKENVGPKEDDGFLPPTQVFMPPPTKTKPLPQPMPPQATSVAEDDDLPPTQVFQKTSAPRATSSKNICLSSTLLDSGMQLSECSFKAKCNKLLDSDDDEMDEVIAPELVKQMRKTLEKQKDADESPENSISPPALQADNTSKEKENSSASKENAIATPKDKFLAPKITAKKTSRIQSAVNIDNFLFTPDFLGKELSKDKQLQELAEVNWENMISEKKRRSLFGEDSDGNPISSESDDSHDGFNDLLPRKKKREKTKKAKSKSTDLVTIEESKETEIAVKVSRRRKSAYPEEAKDVKLPRKVVSEPSIGSKTRSRSESGAKKESTSKKEQKEVESIEEKSEKKQEKKFENSREENSESRGRVKVTLRRMHHKKEDVQKESHKTEEGEDAKKTKGGSKSRNSEKHPSSTTTNVNKRRTRQSPRDLDLIVNMVAKSRQCNESKDLSRSNSDKDKTVVDVRNGIKQKEPEKKNADSGKSDKKAPSDSFSKDKLKSSTRSGKSLHREKKVEKEDMSKKFEKEAVEIAKVEKEDKPPLPRLTRLKSAMEFATPSKTDTDLANKNKSIHREKTSIDINKAVNTLSRRNSTIKKDCIIDKTIDLTNSDSESPNKISSHIQKSNTKNLSKDLVTTTVTLKPDKRKNEAEETKEKRLRSTDMGNSVKPIQSIQNHRSKKQAQKIKIAMTMCDPRYLDVLEKHSGGLWLYTQDPKECNVLVVEKGNRTYKLMVAIARGVPVVRLDWLKEVLNKKSVDIPFEEYIYEDPQFEKRHHFGMKKSLTLAKTASLFKGISFMMTPGIRPEPEEMKDIITCAGGEVLEHVPEPQTNQRIYLVSQSKDNQHWHRYRRSNSNIKIVSSEGVMASVMQQSESPLKKSIIQ